MSVHAGQAVASPRSPSGGRGPASATRAASTTPGVGVVEHRPGDDGRVAALHRTPSGAGRALPAEARERGEGLVRVVAVERVEDVGGVDCGIGETGDEPRVAGGA